MATSGPHVFGTYSSDNTNGGTLVWGSPSNAGTSDDSYTSAGSGASGLTEYLKGVNPNPGLPIGATITQVQLDIERKRSSTVTDNAVYLWNGATLGSNKSAGASWSASDTVDTFTWSIPSDTALTPAQANDSGFGAVLAADVGMFGTANVDLMTITFTYTPTPAATVDYLGLMLLGVRQILAPLAAWWGLSRFAAWLRGQRQTTCVLRFT